MSRGERRAIERARERGYEIVRAPLQEVDPKTQKVLSVQPETSWHTPYALPRKYDGRGQAIGTKKKYQAPRQEFIPPTIAADAAHGGAIDVVLEQGPDGGLKAAIKTLPQPEKKDGDEA